jgi:dTDP-4-dehydrorhamnose reductase
MRILLIGKTGQIGQELMTCLADHNELIAPERSELDLAHPASIASAVRSVMPNVVINAAAYTAVDKAETESALAYDVNAIGVGILANACKENGATLVHYSTDYVFDGKARTPYEESAAICPSSVYGHSKAQGEVRIRDSGCSHLILRTAWVYGKHGRNFMLTMLRLAQQQSRLRVVADQIGCPTWSRTIAEITMALVYRSPIGTIADTVNLVSAGETSWHGFASEILRLGHAKGLCPSIPVEPITSADYPTLAERPAYSVLSQKKLSEQYGTKMRQWEKEIDLCLSELGSSR